MFLKSLQYLISLSKLRIIFSVVVTAVTGYIVASLDTPDLDDLLMLIFTIVFSGMGSAIMNNLLDYPYDEKMTRTRSRTEAIDFLGKSALWGISSILIVISLLVAYLFFDGLLVFFLLVATIFSYVVLYSLFLKRISPFGVVLGGLPGAIPLLIGYAISGVEFNFMIWLMFTFMMLWQPAHFWALTLKIKEEYSNAGVPVLPLVHGSKITKYYIYLYSLPLLIISLLTCYAAESDSFIYLSILLLNIYYFSITYYSLEKTHNYNKAFKSSLVYMGGYMLVITFNHIIGNLNIGT